MSKKLLIAIAAASLCFAGGWLTRSMSETGSTLTATPLEISEQNDDNEVWQMPEPHSKHWTELTAEERYRPGWYMLPDEWEAMGTTPDNPWIVEVADTYSDDSADPSFGNITESGSGADHTIRLFGAHRSSSNGGKIVDHPQYVSLEGHLYEYVWQQIAYFDPDRGTALFDASPVANQFGLTGDNTIGMCTCLKEEEMREVDPNYQEGDCWEYAFYYKMIN